MRYLLGVAGGGTPKLGWWARLVRKFRKPPVHKIQMHVDVVRLQKEAEAERQRILATRSFKL
jgi:hypothetical protein